MSLILEDGSGLATAESYASIAEADTYLGNHDSPASWTAASTDQKEDALRTATEWIDSRYLGRFQGSKVEPRTQRLAFPRYGVEIDKVVLDETPLPRCLVEATIELARRHIDEVAAGSSLAEDVTDGTIKSQSVQLGPISESKTYQGGKPQLKRYTVVTRLLRPLLCSSGLERA